MMRRLCLALLGGILLTPLAQWLFLVILTIGTSPSLLHLRCSNLHGDFFPCTFPSMLLRMGIAVVIVNLLSAGLFFAVSYGVVVLLWSIAWAVWSTVEGRRREPRLAP